MPEIAVHLKSFLSVRFKKLLFYILLVCGATTMLMLASSCPSLKKSPQTTDLGYDVQLPSDWPIPEFVPPLGAKADVIPVAYRSSNYNNESVYSCNTSSGGLFWIVGFDCPLTWQELIDYSENILLPQGFELFDKRGDTPEKPQSYGFLDYKSSNRDITVRIGYRNFPGSILHEQYKGYYFTITTRAK